MASKLPIRKNIEPILQIAAELEEHLEQSQQNKNDKTHKKFSANFNGNSENIEKEDYERIKRRGCKVLLREKDEQIDKLIERLNMLHSYNDQYAAENEKLQNKECELCQKYAANEVSLRESQEYYLKESQQLRDDVKMMKTLVYRLNVQLERHQEMIRKTSHPDQNFCKIDFDAGSQNIDSNWGAVNVHTIGPLLNAYTEMISEKNDLVEQYENELSHFTGRMKSVIEENERLHAEMDEMRRQNEMWSTDKTRLQAQLDICRNKAEIQTKRADLAKEKLVEVLRCYEQKLQSQNLDLERLQEAYARSKGELSALRNLQQSPEVVVESLKECQKLFEELKVQHDIEKKKLIGEVEELRSNFTALDVRNKKEQEEYSYLRDTNQKQKEYNEMLNEKNIALRRSLARIRLSREALKNRLKSSLSWNKNMEGNQRRVKNTWNDLNHVESLLRQKESHVQNVHLRHLDEIEKLTRKLQQRDETLKKVLHAKIKNKGK